MDIMSTLIDRSGKTVMLANTRYGMITGAGTGDQGAIADIDRQAKFRKQAQRFKHHGPVINREDRRR